MFGNTLIIELLNLAVLHGLVVRIVPLPVLWLGIAIHDASRHLPFLSPVRSREEDCVRVGRCCLEAFSVFALWRCACRRRDAMLEVRIVSEN